MYSHDMNIIVEFFDGSGHFHGAMYLSYSNALGTLIVAVNNEQDG